MSRTQDLGRFSNTVPTATSTGNIDCTDAATLQRKSILRVAVSSDQALTLYMKFGKSKSSDSIGSLPHTFSESVTAGTSLMVVMPICEGWDMIRVYCSNASGSTASVTMDAALEEA